RLLGPALPRRAGRPLRGRGAFRLRRAGCAALALQLGGRGPGPCARRRCLPGARRARGREALLRQRPSHRRRRARRRPRYAHTEERFTMSRSDNLYTLPANLPVPEDDGACAHLPGLRLPAIPLAATDGRAIDLAALPGRTV